MIGFNPTYSPFSSVFTGISHTIFLGAFPPSNGFFFLELQVLQRGFPVSPGKKRAPPPPPKPQNGSPRGCGVRTGRWSGCETGRWSGSRTVQFVFVCSPRKSRLRLSQGRPPKAAFGQGMKGPKHFLPTNGSSIKLAFSRGAESNRALLVLK